MPFEDGAFDIAVSADTLEHIPPAKRQQFVHELLRVSRYGMVLVAPFFSYETELAERIFYQYMVAELRYHHPFLQEHREYGLPHLEQTEQWCIDRNHVTTTVPSGYIHTWLEMMLLRTLLWRLTRDDDAIIPLEEYYNRVLFPIERCEPAYRHAVIAAPTQTPILVHAAQQALAPTSNVSAVEAIPQTQFLQQLLTQLVPMGILDRLRSEEETSLNHWQTTAQHWQQEAHRVEAERQKLELASQRWQRETQRVEGEYQQLEAAVQRWRQAAHRVEAERRESEAAVQHWQQEAHRVEVERQALETDAQHWQQEAHRVEYDRRELEHRYQTAQTKWAEMYAQLAHERDHLRQQTQRSLLQRVQHQITRFRR
jgi:hypothetical protein